MRLKVSSAQRRPFCLALNVLNACLHHIYRNDMYAKNIDDFVDDDFIAMAMTMFREKY